MRLARALLAVVLASLAGVAAPHAGEGPRHALIIGNDYHGDSTLRLVGAQATAKALESVLQRTQ